MSKKLADRIGTSALLVIFLVFAIAILANVANRVEIMPEQHIEKGDPSLAPQAIEKYGCGTCHEIPGIVGANATVGPRLDDLSRRSFLAGQIPNNPDNLVLWIMHPQLVRPGGDMPEMGVSESDARNIAAYLYSRASDQNDLFK